MKYSVFGKKFIEVIRKDNAWRIFYLGTEGKKRVAEDIVIPSHIKEGELKDYLADIFHEWASAANSDIKEF